MTANLSCGLLDLRLSREVLDLANRTLQTITDTFQSQVYTYSTMYILSVYFIFFMHVFRWSMQTMSIKFFH